MDHLVKRAYREAERYHQQGIITSEQWEAYQWLWRNSVTRFSHLASRYENTPIPELAKPYIKEKHQ